MKKIIVDSGKYNLNCMCKEVTGDQVMVYKNGISKGNNDAMHTESFSYNVKYNDELYFVGQGAEQINFLEGKSTDDHIITTLVAITHYLKPNAKNEDVILCYNESINSYFNEDNIKSINNKLVKKHSIEVDGNTYTFTITTLQIMPEGVGALFLDIESHLDGVNYLIDIGGCTFNVVVANGMAIDSKKSISHPQGMNYFTSWMAKNFLGKKGYSLDAQQIEKLLKVPSTNKKLNDLVTEGVSVYLDDMAKTIQQVNSSFDINILKDIAPVYFVGGGSLSLKNQIESKYGEGIVHPNALTANVLGYAEYMELKYGEE